MPEQVCNVTAKNYHEKAKAFMEAVRIASGAAEFGVTINIRANTTEWGAWRNYLQVKGVTTPVMDKREKEDLRTIRGEELGYQVPATFPSDFDSDREWVHDQRAGEKFTAEHRERLKPVDKGTAEYRARRIQEIISGHGGLAA